MYQWRVGYRSNKKWGYIMCGSVREALEEVEQLIKDCDRITIKKSMAFSLGEEDDGEQNI